MKKIVLYFLMLPVAVYAQTGGSSELDELSEKAVSAYRQLPAPLQHLALRLLENVNCDEKGAYWVYESDTIRNSETIAMEYLEDNKVTEICNVPFGFSYEKSKNILFEKYGDCDYFASSKDCIAYRDKSYGGFYFTDLFFMFQSDGETSYFNKAVLSKDTKTKDEAVSLKKSIDEKLSKQYSLFQIFDDGDTYLSMGGICPAPCERTYGYAISVDVLKLDKPTRNDCTYAVRIMYGPYDYVEEKF